MSRKYIRSIIKSKFVEHYKSGKAYRAGKFNVFDFNSRVKEDGKPYQDKKGVIYQRYLNGMVRRLTQNSTAVAPDAIA